MPEGIIAGGYYCRRVLLPEGIIAGGYYCRGGIIGIEGIIAGGVLLPEDIIAGGVLLPEGIIAGGGGIIVGGGYCRLLILVFSNLVHLVATTFTLSCLN